MPKTAVTVCQLSSNCEKATGSLVDSEEQNRYIIVNNNENMQETAQKLLTKLLEDALTALSGKLNSLLKY